VIQNVDVAKTDEPARTGLGPLPRWAKTTFGILFVIHLLDYLDRNILTSLQPQIRQAVSGMNGDDANARWGMLATVFLVSFSLFSPVMGWLGDRYRRTWFLAAGVGVWSLATVGSGLARDYSHLVLARSLLGIGEATYGVIATTILCDLFRSDQRSRMMSAFYLAMPLGAAMGIVLGPIIAKNFGGWHNAFFVVGAPGLVAALIVLFLPEPIRGATEGVDTKRLLEQERAGTTREDYIDLMVNSSYTYSVFGMAAYTFAIGGLLVWIPAYLFNTRLIDQEKATQYLGAVTLAASIIGMTTGGWLADRLAKTRPGALFLVPGLAMLGSIPFVILALLSTNHAVIFASIFAAEALMFVNTGPCMAIVANVVQPNLRAAAFAISYAAAHFLGDIWSPLLIGKAADLFGQADTMKSSIGQVLMAIGAVPTQKPGQHPENIVAGLLIVVPALILSGVVFLAGARHLPREMALMKAKLKAPPVNHALASPPLE
jgi:MFS transporter, Spinster family, sphingosine-1-phosphate transporter